MADIEFISDLSQIKILTDPRRLAILRLLMAKPQTLSQLGQKLGEHPAWIRHHLKQLEQHGLVELTTAQVSGGFVEKYYQAKSKALLIQEVILPEKNELETLVIQGSHDLALSLLARRLHEVNKLNLLILPVGSLEGLVALRQGLTHLTSCHLLDIESGEYNLSYVRHIFPDRSVKLVTLAHRVQGLIVLPGNPKQIRGLEDLDREDLNFINRNRGSGTRLWLDKRLHTMGMPSRAVTGFANEVQTHTEVAHMIRENQADVGLGLEAAARQSGLDFIPLFSERYDFVLTEERYKDRKLHDLFDYLSSGRFKQLVVSLGGYDTTHTGETIDP